MAVPQVRTQETAVSSTTLTVPEPMAKHLRRIAAAACWAVAPVVAGLLAFGMVRGALSMLGGAFVSFGVFAGLRVMVYKGMGSMAPEPGKPSEPLGPHMIAYFAIGTLIKFVVAGVSVWAMFKLGATPLTLLLGFVIAQIAIAVTVSRSLKGPV
jgi:hypothetical protein